MKVSEIRIKKYIEEFGIPICKYCNKESGFKKRGYPKKYCSLSCTGKANPPNQEKIKQAMIKKYGVTNNTQLKNVREKMSKSRKGNGNPFYGKQHTVKHKEKISRQTIERWNDPEYKVRTSAAIKKGVNTQKELRRRREWARDNWDLSGRLSKVHQSIRDELRLEELGFTSEVKVLGYSADEMRDNIIIEINGDYIHANPKKYKADDIITIKSSTYTAEEKWKKDAKRKANLEAAGFKVFVIWESDNEQRKQEILFQVRNL